MPAVNKIKLFINNLICPKTKTATHCLTKLFSIYQNKHWTIRRPDNHTAVPLYHRIILKIVGCLSSQCKISLNLKFLEIAHPDLYVQWLWLQEAISSIQICRCLILTLQIHPLPRIQFFSVSNSNAPNYVWYSTPHMGSNMIRIGSVLSLYLQFWKKKCVVWNSCEWDSSSLLN